MLHDMLLDPEDGIPVLAEKVPQVPVQQIHDRDAQRPPDGGVDEVKLIPLYPVKYRPCSAACVLGSSQNGVPFLTVSSGSSKYNP